MHAEKIVFYLTTIVLNDKMTHTKKKRAKRRVNNVRQERKNFRLPGLRFARQKSLLLNTFHNNGLPRRGINLRQINKNETNFRLNIK